MPYELPDGTEIWWHVLIGRRTDSSADVYDTALYGAATYDGGSLVFYERLPESLILSMNVKQGKDRFGKRFRAGSAQVLVDNETGLFTQVNSFASPGDYIWIRQELTLPPGPPDEPIPDGWTWNDETGRQWTAHGSLIWADDTPDVPVEYAQFYGRIDSSVNTVRNGRDVTKLVAYDMFAELAPIDKDAVPSVGAGEDATARLLRIGSNASSAFGGVQPIAFPKTTLQATTLAQGALDMMHLTMESEGGDMWAANIPQGGSGKGIIRAGMRDWLTESPNSTSVQWVLGGSQGLTIIDGAVSKEQQLIVNDATYANVGGVSQNATDAASIQRFGVRTTRRLDLISEDDTQAQFLAQRFVSNLKDIRPRVRQVTVPVLDADSALFASKVEFGDLVLSTISSVNGWSYTALGHVIGKRQQIFEQTWNMVVLLDDAFVDNVDGAFNDEMFSNAFTLGSQGG